MVTCSVLSFKQKCSDRPPVLLNGDPPRRLLISELSPVPTRPPAAMSDPIASTSTSASPPEDDGFSAPITHRKPARAPKHRKNKAPTRPRERTLAERVESRLGPMQATNYLDKCAGKSPPSAWPNTCGRCAVLTAALWLVVAELVEKALAGAGEGEAGPCPRPEDLVCLGLGSVSDSTKSQDQFHLLQTMRKVLAKDVCTPPFDSLRVATPGLCCCADLPPSIRNTS